MSFDSTSNAPEGRDRTPHSFCPACNGLRQEYEAHVCPPSPSGRYPTADVSWASAGICDGCGAKAKVRRYRRVDLGIDKVLCATCAAPPDDASGGAE